MRLPCPASGEQTQRFACQRKTSLARLCILIGLWSSPVRREGIIMWQIPAVLVLISVLFNSATADDRWPSAELLSEKFNEEMFKETPVSGSILAGIVIEQPTSKQSDNLQIFVYWPHTYPPSTICLTVQTRDGTYKSQNPYRIPQVNASTYIRLPYPSKGPDFLREQDAQSIALLA